MFVRTAHTTKVLLDTNVVLDVLLERGGWPAEASVLWQASADGRLGSCVTASSLTDTYYISRRLKGKRLRVRLSRNAFKPRQSFLSIKKR